MLEEIAQSAATSYAVGTNPSSLVAGDFNGDGKLDLAVANKGSQDVSVLINKADGTGQLIVPAYTYALGESGTTIAAIDLNNDLMPDLAVLSSDNNHLDVLLSNAGVAPTGRGAWDDLNTPSLGTIQVNGASQSPPRADGKGRDYLLVGSQDNGIALTTNATGAATWSAVSAADGGLVRFDPNDATGKTAYGVLQFGFMLKSGDNGANWHGIVAGLPPTVGQSGVDFPFMSKFAIDPRDGTRLIIGSNSQVFETRSGGDGANAWAAISNVLDTSGVTALAYAPSNDNDIYVGFADGRVFLTINDGRLWTDVSPGPAARAPVTAIAVSPTNPLLVYISQGGFGGARVLTDANGGGGGWGPFGAGLPNVPVNALVLDSVGNTLYAGTDIGVYSTATGAAAWTRYGTGLPYVQVSDLQLQTFATGTFLAAGTHGRGVWIIDPPDGNGSSSEGGTPSFLPSVAADLASRLAAVAAAPAVVDPPVSPRLATAGATTGITPAAAPRDVLFAGLLHALLLPEPSFALPAGAGPNTTALRISMTQPLVPRPCPTGACGACRWPHVLRG